MVETVDSSGPATRQRRSRSLGGARGVGPGDQPDRRPRRGARGWSRPMARATSTTRRGSAWPTPGTRIHGSWRRSRRRPPSCSTASRTSSTTSRGCGCTSGCRVSCRADRGRHSSRTPEPRPSRARSSWRVRRRAGRPSLRSATRSTAAPARRWPSPRRRTSTAAPGAAPRQRLPRRLPLLLPGGRWTARSRGMHVRLGGAARPAVPPARLPEQGRGDHRRAGHRRGRLHRPAAGVPAAPPRNHPPARDPPHCRRNPDRIRPDR